MLQVRRFIQTPNEGASSASGLQFPDLGKQVSLATIRATCISIMSGSAGEEESEYPVYHPRLPCPWELATDDELKLSLSSGHTHAFTNVVRMKLLFVQVTGGSHPASRH